MTKDLTKGSPLKLIIAFTFPGFLGMLFQQFYNVVDTIIVGKLLGIGPLAGVGATGSLNFMVLGFCMGVCNGFAIPIAQKFGAGDETELRKFVANSLWLTAIFSLVMTVPVCVFCRPILRLMNTPEDVFEYAYRYIFVIFLGIPAAFLYNILAAILRSLGDSKSPVLFLALSSVLNIGLDIAAIRVFGMNVDGTALATVISQGVSGVVCFFYMRKRFTVLHMTPEERKLDSVKMKRLCYMGIPMGLQYSVTAIGSLIIQATMNGFGSVAVAGATAANRINGFLACPIEALGATMAPYTGQNLGAGKLDRVTRGVIDASICGFVCAGVLYVIILLFGAPLTSIFLDVPDPEVIAYAIEYLRIVGAGYCLLTLVNVVRFSIQGLGFSVLAIVSGVMEMIARSLAGLVIAPRIGFAAVAMGHPLAWLFADCFLIPAFLLCRRKAARMLGHHDQAVSPAK